MNLKLFILTAWIQFHLFQIEKTYILCLPPSTLHCTTIFANKCWLFANKWWHLQSFSLPAVGFGIPKLFICVVLSLYCRNFNHGNIRSLYIHKNQRNINVIKAHSLFFFLLCFITFFYKKNSKRGWGRKDATVTFASIHHKHFSGILSRDLAYMKICNFRKRSSNQKDLKPQDQES